MGNDLLLHLTTQVFGCERSLVQRSIRQDHRELFTPIAR